MNEELKKRIAQINSGVVPEGYKKTRVGILPVDWKEEKIGDLFYKVMERNNGQFDRTKWISVSKMYFQEPEKVTSNNIDTRTYVMRLGDMAFEGHPNKDFLFGRFVVNDLGDGIISELFPIYRHKKPYIAAYWKYAIQFESIMARIYVRCITISGASSNKINDEEFSKESLFLPPLPEQQKIAELLTTQDKLIELQEQKIEQLKALKKAYLQKMFPKKGSRYPELRFKGFMDAWEQRKLFDIGDIVTGTTPPTKDKDNYGGDKLFVSPADIQGNRYVINTNTTLTYKGYALGRELRGGTSLFVSIGSTIGKVAQIKDFATTNQQINAVVPFDEMDDDFVFTMLENEADKIKKLSAQQAVPIINKTIFGDTEIKHPEKEEQIKIGQFFAILDSLITLHQRKLDQEKQKKKALMQLLLTGKVRVKP